MTANTRITCAVPVFYATNEGHTRRIAERIAQRLRASGIDSMALDLSSADASLIDWRRVRGAIVGASLHGGRHQRHARRFVSAHAPDLNRVPTLFVSVSLSAASEQEDEVRTARRIAEEMPAAHGWHPTAVESIAGCLAYTKYGWLKRWVMKRIAAKEGAPMDTSRDYDLTNWSRVEELARQFADRLTAEERSAA